MKLTVFDAKFTTNVQVNQLRNALVSKKYQAWFIGPNDGGPLTPTIKAAVAQGVKVGCSHSCRAGRTSGTCACRFRAR